MEIKKLHTYLVTWQIDTEATSPVEAAIQALQVQKRWDSSAKVFDVRRHGEGVLHRVDLDRLRLNLCDECGAKCGVEGLSCPDGAYICQSCFNKGLH